MRSERPVTPFGRWLQETCAAGGMTQAELARRAGLNRSSLSAVARGHAKPTLRICTAVAGALNLPLAEVLQAAGALAPDEAEPQLDPKVRELIRELETLPADLAASILAAWRSTLEVARAAAAARDGSATEVQ